MALRYPTPTKHTSFKQQYIHRHVDFRTPSPPAEAIEIFSPQQWTTFDLYPSANSKSRKRKLQDSERNQARQTGGKKATYPLTANHHNVPKKNRHDGSAFQTSSNHTFTQASPSPLDVFAAVATSPSMGITSIHGKQSQWVTHSRHVSESAMNASFGAIEHSFNGTHTQLTERKQDVTDSRPATSHYPLSSREQNIHAKTFETHDTNTNSMKSNVGLGISNSAPGSSLEDARLLLTLWEGSSNRSQTPLRQSHIQSTNIPDTNGHRHDQSKRLTHIISPHASTQLHGSVYEQPHVNGARVGLSSCSDRVQDPSWVANHVTSSGGKRGSQKSVRLKTEEYLDSTIQKPKVRGWPKGKPRGPRNMNNVTKKSTPKARPRKNADRSLQSTPQQTGRSESISLGRVNPGSARPSPPVEKRRRYSGTDLEDPIPRTIWADNICKRASSAGPVIQSPARSTKRLATASQQPRQRKSRVYICTSCNSEKNPMNGYQDFWIFCNGCKNWFHHICVGFKSEREVNNVDKFHCENCQPLHGPTTYVRKSSRAHTAVDYAGLNEGKIRSAHDVPHHHYIEPIKEGRIQLQPESFPRMRPELVTAEFFQKSGSMQEPIVIPAEWNSQPAHLWHANDGVTRYEDFEMDYEYDCVPDEGQDKLDMIIPQGLTVRYVSELYGPEEKLEVIDVKSQEGGDKRWNMTQWANYYEAEGEKPVRNVISLEVSASKLGRLIRRPKIVRDLDLQDAVWPEEEAAKGIFPRVQFYCLMSVADCYTDFHIDFGGSSVYYHILRGKKVFFFIPPRKQHLKKYEEWCLSSNQGSIFLGDETKECYRVDLSEGDTMLIPSGWIHAVWTPENSLVIGGNFLTRMHYGMQIQINDIEKNTGVARKFRYPHFQKIQWHAVLDYLEKDPLPYNVAKLLWSGDAFERKNPVYHEYGESWSVEQGSEYFNARYYSEGEIDGIQDLIRYCFRTVMISLGKVAGISKTTQDAVVRSLPKGRGDHFEIIQTFALWAAWKRGNEQIPPWAYPHAVPEDIETNAVDKKPAAPGSKRKGRPPKDTSKLHPERRSARQIPREQPIEAHVENEEKIVRESNEARNSFSETCTFDDNLKVATDPFQRVGIQPDPSDIVAISAMAVEQESMDKSVLPAPSASLDRQDYSSQIAVVIEETRHKMELTEDTLSGQNPSIVEEHVMTDIVVPNATSPPLVGQNATQKRSRTKACEDCKKSKRRCIHDENGQINPFKAQESPVRRGPQSSKRARGSVDAGVEGTKKARRASSNSLKMQALDALQQIHNSKSLEALTTVPPSAEQIVHSFIQHTFDEQMNYLPTPQSNDESRQTSTENNRSTTTSPCHEPTDEYLDGDQSLYQVQKSTRHESPSLNIDPALTANTLNTTPCDATMSFARPSPNTIVDTNAIKQENSSPTIVQHHPPHSTKCENIAETDAINRQSSNSATMTKPSVFAGFEDDGLVSPPLSPPFSPFTDVAPSSPARISNETIHTTISDSKTGYPAQKPSKDDQVSVTVDKTLENPDFHDLQSATNIKESISRNLRTSIKNEGTRELLHVSTDLSLPVSRDSDMEFARTLAEQDFSLRRRK